MLLAAQEEGTGEGMSDAQVRDEVMTIFLAGHETTANALAWALYLLARHPDAYRRLRAEAIAVLGGRTADRERHSSARVRAPGLQGGDAGSIRPRTSPAASRCATSRSAAIASRRAPTSSPTSARCSAAPEYFPDPDRFDPDRFDARSEKTIPRGAYVPFGAGARICIGNNFAMMEGQLILATLAQRVELSLATPGEIAPEPLVTLRPLGGVPMRVKRLPSVTTLVAAS